MKKYTPPHFYTILLKEIQLKISMNFKFKIRHDKLNCIYKELMKKRPKQNNLVPQSLFWLDFYIILCCVNNVDDCKLSTDPKI